MRRRVLLAAAALTACSTPEDADPGAIEAMVLETCAPGGDPVETEVCECAFDEVRERFDADGLDRLDRQLRDDPDTVPAAVQEAVLACGFDRVSPPTTKQAETSTTRPRPTTTSTTRLP